MILLLGGRGFMSGALSAALRKRGSVFRVVSRAEVDYTDFSILRRLIEESEARFVINAAGFVGRPNVDACEYAKAETILGNVVLPQTVGQACLAAKIPWGHISSGCVYSGAWVQEDDGEWRIERDLSTPLVQQLLKEAPERVRGFSETDEPNFSFRHPPCSFYGGCKALAEEVVRDLGAVYIWRLRLPFHQGDGPRNLISKLLRYPRILESTQSMSHLGDFANACLDLWERRAEFGTYNITNPGWISTRTIVEMIQEILQPERTFEFWKDDREFAAKGAEAPRSNTILETSKLEEAGIRLREVGVAVRECLEHWEPEAPAK